MVDETKISGVFAYMVPVYVEIEDGKVVSVRVDDTHPVEEPWLVDPDDDDEAQLKALLDVAEAQDADWPAWGWV